MVSVRTLPVEMPSAWRTNSRPVHSSGGPQYANVPSARTPWWRKLARSIPKTALALQRITVNCRKTLHCRCLHPGAARWVFDL